MQMCCISNASQFENAISNRSPLFFNVLTFTVPSDPTARDKDVWIFLSENKTKILRKKLVFAVMQPIMS